MDIAVEIPPVEHILHHAGMVGGIRRGALAPAALAGHRAGIGVEQELGLVKQQTARRVIRPVHTVSVFKLRDLQPEHDHRPRIADAETVRDGQHRIGLLLGAVEQAELAAGCADRMDGKADAAGHDGRAVDQKQAGTHREPRDLLGGMQLAVRCGRDDHVGIGHMDSSFLLNRTALLPAYRFARRLSTCARRTGIKQKMAAVRPFSSGPPALPAVLIPVRDFVCRLRRANIAFGTCPRLRRGTSLLAGTCTVPAKLILPSPETPRPACGCACRTRPASGSATGRW